MADTPQYDATQIDEVQHPTLGPLKFPKAMPFDERNKIIADMESKNAKPTTADNAIEKARPSTFSRLASEAAALPARVAGVNVEKDAGTKWLGSMVRMAGQVLNPARVGPPGFVKDIVNQMNDTSREGTTIAKTGRSVETAAPNETGAFQARPGGPVQKLGGELEHPVAAGLVRAAASALPVVGPAAVKVGHNMATGAQDPISNAFDAATVAGQAATAANPEMVERAVSPVTKPAAGLVRAAGRVLGNAGKATVESYGIGVPGESLVKKGLAPYAKQTGYDAAMDQAKDEIVRYHQENPIKNVKDLHEALPEIKERIAKEQLNPVAQKHATEVLAPERMERVSQAVHDSVSPFTEEFNEGQAEQVRALAEKLARPRTVGDIIGTDAKSRGGLLGYINAHLESYFAKYPSARAGDLMRNPDTAAWETAREQLREEVLDHLEQQGEAGIRDARKTYGAIKELQKTTERRINVNDRAKPMSLPRILGLISGATVLPGVGFALGEIAHQLNKPDVLVSRGIGRMAKVAGKTINLAPESVTETGTAPSPAKLLRASKEYLDAKMLVQQTLDAMRSGDRPGHYFDSFGQTDEPLTAFGRANTKGATHGGIWRGVKSMRTMLPWISDTEFTPQDLEDAIKATEQGRPHRVMKSAREYIARRAKEQLAEREPGEEDAPF
jgi:hypothetical protein